MTTFALPYVSYFLYDVYCHLVWAFNNQHCSSTHQLPLALHLHSWWGNCDLWWIFQMFCVWGWPKVLLHRDNFQHCTVPGPQDVLRLTCGLTICVKTSYLLAHPRFFKKRYSAFFHRTHSEIQQNIFHKPSTIGFSEKSMWRALFIWLGLEVWLQYGDRW